jgi:hypothetical protein
MEKLRTPPLSPVIWYCPVDDTEILLLSPAVWLVFQFTPKLDEVYILDNAPL